MAKVSAGEGSSSEEGSDAEEEESGEDKNPCTTGLVGQVRRMGSASCIDSCPNMCRPLGDALRAFLRRGGARALKRVVCREQTAFSCVLAEGNLHNCASFLSKAKAFGFHLPGSTSELTQMCR